jgi:hypothetical protein
VRIALKGTPAGILRLAQENKWPSETDDLLDQNNVGCGGVQPAVLAAMERGGVTAVGLVKSSPAKTPSSDS